MKLLSLSFVSLNLVLELFELILKSLDGASLLSFFFFSCSYIFAEKISFSSLLLVIFLIFFNFISLLLILSSDGLKEDFDLISLNLLILLLVSNLGFLLKVHSKKFLFLPAELLKTLNLSVDLLTLLHFFFERDFLVLL